jgi:hypothetical protein
MVETLLHRINPSAQKNMHQTPQGMTKNHYENDLQKSSLGWLEQICNHVIFCCQIYELVVITYGCCKGTSSKT